MELIYKDAIKALKRKPIEVLKELVQQYKNGGVLENGKLLNPKLKELDFLSGMEIKAEGVFSNTPNNKGMRGKLPIVCLFHETTSDDSSNLIFYEDSCRIGCFSGKCNTLKGPMEITDVYVFIKFGKRRLSKKEVEMMSPEVAEKENSEYNKLFFKAVAELTKTVLNKTIESKGFTKKPIVLSKEEKKALKMKTLAKAITDFYHENFLNSPDAKRYFLEERGFKNVENPGEIITKFKIGYAGEAFPSEQLIEKFEGEYTTEELIEANAVMLIKDGKWLTDFHNESLMINYWDEFGESTLVRYGRSTNPEVPKKYRHKRSGAEMQYPLNFYQAIKNNIDGEINLFEGEISLISALAVGKDNSMGTFGTQGMKEEYYPLFIKAREQYGVKIINFCYDPDDAGIESVLIKGKRFIELGFIVKVTILDKGMDANDYLKKDRANDLKEAFNNAVPFYKFMLENEFKEIQDKEEVFVKFDEIVMDYNVDDATKYTMTEHLAQIIKMPTEIVWSKVHKESKNKNIQVLKRESYAYVTKDIESFYLVNFATNSMAVYLEDLKDILSEEITSKLLIVEKKSYVEEEISEINEFAKERNLKIAMVEDFKRYLESSMKFEELKHEILNT